MVYVVHQKKSYQIIAICDLYEKVKTQLNSIMCFSSVICLSRTGHKIVIFLDETLQLHKI
jgi:hypothetical protein